MSRFRGLIFQKSRLLTRTPDRQIDNSANIAHTRKRVTSYEQKAFCIVTSRGYRHVHTHAAVHDMI